MIFFIFLFFLTPTIVTGSISYQCYRDSTGAPITAVQNKYPTREGKQEAQEEGGAQAPLPRLTPRASATTARTTPAPGSPCTPQTANSTPCCQLCAKPQPGARRQLTVRRSGENNKIRVLPGGLGSSVRQEPCLCCPQEGSATVLWKNSSKSHL